MAVTKRNIKTEEKDKAANKSSVISVAKPAANGGKDDAGMWKFFPILTIILGVVVGLSCAPSESVEGGEQQKEGWVEKAGKIGCLY